MLGCQGRSYTFTQGFTGCFINTSSTMTTCVSPSEPHPVQPDNSLQTYETLLNQTWRADQEKTFNFLKNQKHHMLCVKKPPNTPWHLAKVGRPLLICSYKIQISQSQDLLHTHTDPPSLTDTLTAGTNASPPVAGRSCCSPRVWRVTWLVWTIVSLVQYYRIRQDKWYVLTPMWCHYE